MTTPYAPAAVDTATRVATPRSQVVQNATALNEKKGLAAVEALKKSAALLPAANAMHIPCGRDGDRRFPVVCIGPFEAAMAGRRYVGCVS